MLAGTTDPITYYKQIIKALKFGSSQLDQLSKAEKICDDSNQVVGYLSPLSQIDLTFQTTIEELMVWRDRHQYAYPTRFNPSAEGTATWLKKAVIENDNRILFWILDANLVRVGHLGLIYNTENKLFEVDNVLRGSAASPGLITLAMKSLENWAEIEFSAEVLQLKVLKSNARAVSFYESLGYKTVNEIPLVELFDDGITKLIEGTPAQDHFLRMTKSLLKNTIPDLILTAGPSISGLERSQGLDAITRGWNGNHSDYLNEFEKEFAEYVGSKHAMATSSCTGALHISLLSLGIGPGDEVIVPEITWVATASAVRYVGATPIFADVDPDTWTLTAETIRAVITEKTKAIMPVHLYGFAAPMEEILTLAREFDLKIIEDAAPAIGTLIDGKPAGSFGDFGCYSFQGAKMLVTGEGGMLVTDNDELYARARKIQDHGRRPGTFWIEELGQKYKMSNSTAAIGLGQLRRSENQILRKKRIRDWYEVGLRDVTNISFQEERIGTRSIHWMTSITLGAGIEFSRDEFITELRQKGIDSRPVFPAISQYPIWDRVHEAKTIAKSIGERSINLPSGVLLSQASVMKICEVIAKLAS